MFNNARTAPAVLIALMAFGLAACGGDEPAATTAKVAFYSQPAADVWIGGEVKGKTPITVELPAGDHQIAFKADGFADESQKLAVVGGKHQTLSASLALAEGASKEAFKTLLASLDAKMESPDKIETHRGGNNELITIFWPQGQMRMEAIKTLRIDTGPDYEFDGELVVKKGSKELYRSKFEPEFTTTWADLPANVLENLKYGSTYKIGVEFTGKKKKKSVWVKFKPVRGAKAERGIAKLVASKHFLRQKPFYREMAVAEKLLNYRLYAEYLMYSLDILNRNPEKTQPFRNIVLACQRMDLKGTELYEVASQFVSGKGQLKPVQPSANMPEASGPRTAMQLPNTVRQNQGDQNATSGPRPNGAYLPPMAEETGAASSSPTVAGAGAPPPGVTAEGGLPPGPENQGEPGANFEAEILALNAVASGLAAQADELENEAARLDEQATRLEEAEAAAIAAEASTRSAQSTVDAAQVALDAARTAADAPGATAADRDAFDAAQQAFDQAMQALDVAAEQQREAEDIVRQQVHAAGGSPDELRRRANEAIQLADQMRIRANEAGEAAEHATHHPAERAELAAQAAAARQQEQLLSLQRQAEQADALLMAAGTALNAANETLAAVLANPASTAQERDAANRAVEEADQRMQDAERIAAEKRTAFEEASQ